MLTNCFNRNAKLTIINIYISMLMDQLTYDDNSRVVMIKKDLTVGSYIKLSSYFPLEKSIILLKILITVFYKVPFAVYM